ncbi:hypothetical protein D7X12_07570 [Corallococcus sicarius]|uniref:Glycosyltransferase RgtA/B/C/D-like domain-containing protein n=2 Tax=Corallococcus sicarius TaxID=2316726 RepID=A0A3A8NQF3_9BACT|nr:hypothetical protein D7X12_07570 [Corallococcus sicarius]
MGLGCWALSLWLAVTWLLPGSPWGPTFSSDGAIPLVMARAPRVDLYFAYYLGQDRFGAWPFLLARLIGGRDWAAEGLAAVLIAATWTSIFPLAWLSRQGVVAVGLCVLVPLVLALPEEVRPYLLDISQPYGWQFAMLAWTWMGLRGLMEARTRPGVWGWGMATTLAAALTVWISTSSLPSLVVFLGVEVLRARARGLTGWHRFAAATIPLVVGGTFERQLRRLYHRFAKRNHGHDFRTTVALDRGHLWENLRQVTALLWTGPVPLAGVLLVLLGIAATWAVRHGRRGWSAWASLSEPGWLALGCGLAALAQLPLLVAVSHVRLNAYSLRYLAPAHALALVALGVLVLAWLAARVSEGVLRTAGALAVAALAVAALIWRGPSEVKPDSARARDAALAVAQVAPGRLMMGGYWDVYQLAGLQPLASQLLPLPSPEEYQRTPFFIPTMKAARDLVWVQPTEGESPPAPLERELHGVKFHREPEPWLRVPGYTFWKYVRAPGP